MKRDLAVVDTQLIKEKLLSKMHQPFVAKYVNSPQVDEDKIAFLYFLLHHHVKESEIAEAYLYATMFVQAALDTHEFVSEGEMLSDEMRKNRQLTVLSGIYYSSFYYVILAQAGEITATKWLAHAIEEINEQKMKLYHQDFKTIEQIIESIKMAETNLLLAFSKQFNSEKEAMLAKEFFFVKRYLKEEKMLLNNQFSLLFHSLLPVFFTKRELKKRIDEVVKQKQNEQMIQTMRKYISTSIQKILNVTFSNGFNQYISKQIQKWS